MDTELREYLEGMKAALTADIKGLTVDNKGLTADMKGLKADVKGLTADMKGLKADIERVEAELKADIERVETALLTEFHKWASPAEARARTHAAALRAIDLEMESLTERVQKLEDR